jgi:serine phosphatase RsbU (regulator of sigma subunit)
MEQKKTEKSLRSVFLLVVILTYALAIAGGIFAFYRSALAISDDYIKRYALSQNMLEKNHLLSIVERELALSQKLADDPLLLKWFINEHDPEIQTEVREQLDSYYKSFRYKTYFAGILNSLSYYNRGKNSPKMDRKGLNPEDPVDRWFFEALKSNQDYGLNVNYDLLLDEVLVWINVMVKDKDGQAIGITGTGMDLTGFLEALVDHRESGINTVIINHRGEIQAHRDRKIVQHNGRAKSDSEKITIFQLIKDQESKQKLEEMIKNAIKTDVPQVSRLQLTDSDTFVTLSYIAGLNWLNMVIVDTGSIIGLKEFLPLGIVFVCSLLITLLGLILVLNRLIINPLAAFTRAADVVADGAYDTTLPEEYNNEIGRLGRTFNRMTGEIRRYTENLQAMVEERTTELSTANKELVESQQKMLDSLQYAGLIQQSILPAKPELEHFLADHFVIFKPLQLVGGDMYFLRAVKDGFCIATIDCTGHGVPGAFMTMMVNALLNRVIETRPDDGPAAMLETLHTLVQETLRSESETAHLENGLDIALCKIDLNERILRFAGGGLPLFIAENGKIREIPGDKIHLGFLSSKRRQHFTEHRFEIKAENRYYLVTDGIFDLPGGKKGFGLGRRGFLKLIEPISDKAPKEQEKLISNALEKHMGNFLPKDDMILFGFQVTRRRTRSTGESGSKESGVKVSTGPKIEDVI